MFPLLPPNHRRNAAQWAPALLGLHGWVQRLTAFVRRNSTVISVFAIVILSIIGGLYRAGHEEFVGGVEDPDDGKAVSGTIFTAVIVYVVRFAFMWKRTSCRIGDGCTWRRTNNLCVVGFPCVLRPSGHASCTREQERSDCPIGKRAQSMSRAQGATIRSYGLQHQHYITYMAFRSFIIYCKAWLAQMAATGDGMRFCSAGL
jgi:ribonuclease kappa